MVGEQRTSEIESRKSQRGRQAGFTLVEIVVVVLIMGIIAAIAIPPSVQIYYDLTLRSGAAQVAGILQQARMLSTRTNKLYAVRYTTSANGLQEVYIDLNADSTLDPGDPYVDLPQQITAASGAPSGSGQPTAYVYTADTTSGTPYDNTKTLGFSTRGLPCNYVSSSNCSTPSTTYFVYYFVDGRPNGWSAVLVTKAGRTQVLSWNGSAWH